jgi:hypothetical protein
MVVREMVGIPMADGKQIQTHGGAAAESEIIKTQARVGRGVLNPLEHVNLDTK